MRKHIITTLLLVSTVALSLQSSLSHAALEASFETSTRKVPAPLTPYAELVLANCSTCPTVKVHATPATRYFIGDEEVKLKDLREYLATRPSLLSCVYYTTPGRSVTRFVVARLEPLTSAAPVSAVPKVSKP